YEIWGSMMNGARVVVAPPGRPDPREVGALIANRGVNVALISAGMLAEIVRVAASDLGGMRALSSGADVLHPATVAELRAALPHLPFFNNYGPTEATISAIDYEVRDPEPGPIPIGSAIPGYTLHILGEDDTPVPPGEPGELWIGGPGVARGYRDD